MQKKIKCHIKRNDKVKVISGNDKNKIGKIVSIDTKKRRAVVEGVNIRTFHIKPTQKNPKGKREQKAVAVHISNLMLVEPTTQEITRTGRKLNEEGILQRYSKKTGNFI